ncbi:MAG: radical SAM protein [Clostridia bacterium]|nr:radical SAM protein [Clostridia bacterium]
MKCNLCPRQCNAERGLQNNEGYCRMPLQPVVARADLHFWEEPIISGSRGSGTVFFSGCSLGCVYCQNYEISNCKKGKEITINRLAEIFSQLEEKGAHNINLVNPTHYALAIKQALSLYRPKIPIVYNSSGYESVKTLEMLKEYIDIYLLDFKYMSEDRAALYSKAGDYPEIAKKAIKKCCEAVNEPIIENGIMKKGVIIRHLLLPRATNEAIKIFDWVRENAPQSYFSLMSQYIPYGKAGEFAEINRRVTNREYEKVTDYICKTSFLNVFIQERDSSDKKYIPEFDFSGV